MSVCLYCSHKYTWDYHTVLCPGQHAFVEPETRTLQTDNTCTLYVTRYFLYLGVWKNVSRIADSSMASTYCCTAPPKSWIMVLLEEGTIRKECFQLDHPWKKHRKFMLFVHLLLSVDTWFFLPFCCNWMVSSFDVLHKWRRKNNILLYIYGIEFFVESNKGMWGLSFMFVIWQGNCILNKEKKRTSMEHCSVLHTNI